MMLSSSKVRPPSWLLAATLVLAQAPLQAAPLEEARDRLGKAHHQGAALQRSIDRLDTQTREKLQHYQATLRQAELLEAYNRQLAAMVKDQERELADIEVQLDSLARTEQATLPLLGRMLEALRGFVKADQPFQLEERRERIERLERLLVRADVSLAEKYRQMLEAYQIEAEYGRTLEAWTGSLQGSPDNPRVTFVRIGRVALYYQSLDGSHSGRWDPQQARWEPLEDAYNWPLRQAIRLARQQTVPGLLSLPLAALSGQGGDS